MMRVLVIEDGYEYSEVLARFLASRLRCTRAGSGPQALALLEDDAGEPFDVVFLDMRFDRTPADQLLGDLDALLARYEPMEARRFLEDHQGTYVLAALRAAGHNLPVMFSCDFDREPQRWGRLRRRYSAIDYLPDNLGPGQIADRLQQLVGAG